MERKIFEIEDKEICKACGGLCCKSFPGLVTPKDVGAPDTDLMRQNLLEMLRSGRYCVDWINQEEGLYFVRPAIKGNENVVFGHLYNGECTFLTPTGCQLTFEKRPESCRTLIPKVNEKCDPQNYTRMKIAKMWKEYVNLLIDCAVEIENGDMEDVGKLF